MNLKAALDCLVLEDMNAYLAVIPPDVDDLADEDELNDEDTATPLVCDVPGLVDVVNDDREKGSDVPCKSTHPNLRLKSNGKKDQKLLGKRKIPSTASGQT